MAPLSVAGILKELDDVVGDQLQVVTYKWLGRRYNVPYDTAKRILFEFVTRHPQKVKATFLLSGWGESEDGVPARHIVRVVDGQRLEAEKAKLSLVTGMHVYSVQPGVPKDAGDLYNTDYAQTLELFKQLLASTAAEAEGNPLASNLLNAVQCPGVRFDPALAARRPRPASAAPAPATGAAAKAIGGATAATKPAAPAASPPGKAAAKPGAAAKSPLGKPSGGAAKKGAAGGSAMAAMWSKAGEKSKAKAPKAASEEPAAQAEAAPLATEREGQQQAAPKVKGKAAAKPASKPVAKPAAKPAAAPLPASDDSWEDSEEEEQAVMAVGHNKGKKSRQLLEESESEGEPEAPPAKRGKASKAAEDGGKKEAGSKKAAGSGKRKKPAKGEEAGEGGDGGGDEAGEAAPAPMGPKRGTVKVRDPEPGAKRVRREMRTFYNDAGEEVTELVEVQEEEEAPPAQQQPQQPQQQQQQQQQAPKPAPKPAAKPAAGSGGSKKGGKGAPPPGQKGIMSFFGKK